MNITVRVSSCRDRLGARAWVVVVFFSGVVGVLLGRLTCIKSVRLNEQLFNVFTSSSLVVVVVFAVVWVSGSGVALASFRVATCSAVCFLRDTLLKLC